MPFLLRQHVIQFVCLFPYKADAGHDQGMQVRQASMHQLPTPCHRFGFFAPRDAPLGRRRKRRGTLQHMVGTALSRS